MVGGGGGGGGRGRGITDILGNEDFVDIFVWVTAFFFLILGGYFYSFWGSFLRSKYQSTEWKYFWEYANISSFFFGGGGGGGCD